MGVRIEIRESRDMDRLLAQVGDNKLRRKVWRKALREAGKIVQKRAKQLAPRSKRSGTRELWSEATRSQRAGAKALHQTITVAVRDYGEVWVLVVGPSYPAGALGHLIEYGHAEVLFGVPTGRRVPPKPFLRPAADETQGQVNGVIVASLQSQLESL